MKKQEIMLAKTVTGVQVIFSEPVHVSGTLWGTRIGLTEEDAWDLYRHLGRYLADRVTFERVQETPHDEMDT